MSSSCWGWRGWAISCQQCLRGHRTWWGQLPFVLQRSLLQAKLHGPGLDFPRPALGGRRQWDGCLLGRGWAAPEAMDKGDCCRDRFISVEHDLIGSHVFLLGEGRRTLLKPQFSYCCLRRNDQATFGTPGCGCAWGCTVLNDTSFCSVSFLPPSIPPWLSRGPDPFLGSPFN